MLCGEFEAQSRVSGLCGFDKFGEAFLGAFGVGGFVWDDPFARTARREKESRDADVIGAVLLLVAPTFTGPDEGRSGKHSVDSVDGSAVGEEDANGFDVAAHGGAVERFDAVAVFYVWIEAAREHGFESFCVAAFGGSLHHQMVIAAKFAREIRMLF